jgi:hypothetical protein
MEVVVVFNHFSPPHLQHAPNGHTTANDSLPQTNNNGNGIIATR